MSERRPAVMLTIPLAPGSQARLEAAFTVHQATTHEARIKLANERGAELRAIVTNGTTVLPAALMELMPALGIICAQGVGHEGVDLAYARARGIAVTHGPGVNAGCVADHAMALTLAMLRDIPRNDAATRAGNWRTAATMRPMAGGKRVGILGLGAIGERIARRCTAFEMTVAYHSRRRRPDVPWPYAATPLALAEQADILMVVLPGGAATRHLVGAAELEALGPTGYLVNVGRGSVVETAALVQALRAGRLAGAALDVFDGEPVVPEALRELGNVVLTPHMAGRSPETAAATIELVIGNLTAFFGGAAVLTPVPA